MLCVVIRDAVHDDLITSETEAETMTRDPGGGGGMTFTRLQGCGSYARSLFLDHDLSDNAGTIGTMTVTTEFTSIHLTKLDLTLKVMSRCHVSGKPPRRALHGQGDLGTSRVSTASGTEKARFQNNDRSGSSSQGIWYLRAWTTQSCLLVCRSRLATLRVCVTGYLSPR